MKQTGASNFLAKALMNVSSFMGAEPYQVQLNMMEVVMHDCFELQAIFTMGRFSAIFVEKNTKFTSSKKITSAEWKRIEWRVTADTFIWL